MSVNEQAVPEALDADQKRLHELGYAQELRRRMSGFSNFAVSFTIISILSGCLTLYGFGMLTGGPAVIVWGWPFVGIMTLFVGLSMAEVCSSFPTAGGLYYWAAKLAPAKTGPAWSWFTGWFNFLGQVAVTAGIDFGAAFFVHALLSLVFNLSTAHWVTIVIYAIILFVHGLLNQFGIRLVALLNDISVWWHILGVLIIVGVLAFAAVASPVGQLCLRALLQRDRPVRPRLLHRPDRPAAGAVHLHRLRRLGAHDRGDPRRRHRGPARHRDVHRGLADRRLGAADRRHLRDPELRRRGRLGDRRAAGPDLPRRDREDGRGAAVADRVRRPAVLRHVVGHRQLPDDLRVLPGRRAAGLGLLAPGEQAHQDPDQRDLAGRRRRAHPRAALPVELRRLRGRDLHRGHRPVHRLRDADLPAAAPGRGLQARAVAPGPVELRGRLDRRRLGGDHLLPVHAAAGRADHLHHLQLRHRSRCSWSSASPGSTGWSPRRHWFKGPKVQGTAEELAAIEHELAS